MTDTTSGVVPTASDEIAAHKAEFERWNARHTEMTFALAQDRTRLGAIDREIHEAEADGDTERATALRNERTALQASIPDKEGALSILHRRYDDADKQLARVQLPGLRESLANDTRIAMELLERLRAHIVRMDTAESLYRQRFSRAALPPDQAAEFHVGALVAMPDFARRVRAIIRDIPPVEPQV